MSVRSKMFMMVQYLNPDYYNWTSKKYSDTEIIRNANKYGSNAYKNKDNKFHYLYVIYNSYYFPLVNSYQHPFNDYGFIFNSKVPLKSRAKLIQLHIAMRLNYFYFRDTLHNEKHRKGKHGQTNIVPPIVASKMHNRDVKNALTRNKDITKVTIAPHLHFVIKFNKRKSSSQLSKWCGVAPQYFESGKGGRYALENAMAYLIHAKQPQKHLYDFRDVWSNKPVFDYQNYYLRHYKKWRSYRATDTSKSHHVNSDWLTQQVQHGALTKQDILAKPQYRYIYADNMNKINEAVQFHAELEGELTLMALKARKFSLSVFYIWGQPGSGKTSMALNLAHEIAKKHHWRVYQSAPTNPLDDYSGEQIALLDDIRSETMGASDWLKLLDPINISPNSARYHNKTITARVIIMTNPEPPAKFFGYMKNVHGNEPLSQFIRRLTEIAHVIDARGNHEVLVSNIRKLKNPYPIKIGEYKDASGDNNHAITRSTRYVSNPNQNVNLKLMPHDRLMNVSDAVNDLSNLVNKRNNPKVKHPNKDKNMIDLEEFLNGWKVPEMSKDEKREARQIGKDAEDAFHERHGGKMPF